MKRPRLEFFYLFLLASLTFSASLVFASPLNLTYQGRILKSDGTPLEYSNVSFIFEIANPTGSCVIYREQVDGINMANSKGIFDVPIGTGTRLFPTTPIYKFSTAFENSTSHPCYGGSTFTALEDDNRVLKVQFHDGSGWRLISPNNIIRSVPYALSAFSAAKLGNLSPTDFVLKTNVPGTACGAGQVITFDGVNFNCVVDAGSSGVINDILAGTGINVSGASTKTISISANGVSATELASNSVTTVKIADGQVTGSKLETLASVTAGAYGSATSVPSVTVDTKGRVTAISTNPIVGLLPTANGVGGKYLKSDGTSWSAQNIQFSDIKNSTGTSAFNTGTCAANQTVKWSSLTDMFECQNIGSLDASMITTGTISAARLPAGVATQWNTSGSDIYYNAGNVGIGTTSPMSNLDVANGWASVRHSASDAALMLSSNSGAYGIVQARNFANTANNPLALQPLGGNVGIGTSSPSYKLDVAGDVNVTGNFKVNGVNIATGGGTVTNVSSVNGDIGVATGSSTPVLTLNSGTGANQIAKLDGTGKLPSSTLPSSALTTSSSFAGDVSGTSTATSVDKIKGTSVSAAPPTSAQFLVYNGTTQYAPVSLSGDATMAANGAVTLKNTGTVGTYTKVTTDAQGRVTSGTTLSATDIPALDWSKITTGKPTTLSGYGITDGVTNITATAPLTSSGGTTPNIAISQANATTNGFLSSTDWNTFNTKLGTTSTFAGDMSGTSSTTSVDKIKGKAVMPIAYSAGQTLRYDGTNWVNAVLGFGDVSGTVTTAQLPTIPVSKGGTGTTTLTANRILASDGTGSAVTTFSCGIGQLVTFDSAGVMGCTSYSSSGIFANGGNSFGAAATLGTNDNFALNLETNGATRMTLLPTGNVGVGTNTPGAPLTVKGEIRQNDNSGFYSFYDTTGATRNGYLQISSTDTALVQQNAAPIRFFTSNTERVRIDSNGNVGIGTTTPQSGFALDVNGAILNRSNTFVHGVNSAAPAGGRVWQSVINTVDGGYSLGVRTDDIPTAGNVSTAPFKIFPNASTDSLALKAGNVGVGTANPGYKMEVRTIAGTAGMVQTDGTVSVGSSTTASSGQLGTISNHRLDLFTNNNTRVSIDTSGNVGIGTTAPSATLEVSGTIKGSIAGNFSNIYVTQYDPGVGSTGTWTYSSYVACPAGTTLIMKSMISCTGSSSNTYQYCTCEQSGNSIRAGYISSSSSANTNFMTSCQGLCAK